MVDVVEEIIPQESVTDGNHLSQSTQTATIVFRDRFCQTHASSFTYSSRIRIDDYKNDPKAVQFYTGLQD